MVKVCLYRVPLQRFSHLNVSQKYTLKLVSQALTCLSLYAAFDNTDFSLDSSDCVPAMSQGCMRNQNNSENTVPRWARLRNELYNQLISIKHCIFWCGSVCECEQVIQWGPENWCGNDSISVWKQYLSFNGIFALAYQNIRCKLWRRGIDIRKMMSDNMRKELANHSDFWDDKTKIKHELNRNGHICILLPKFHCELIQSRGARIWQNDTWEHTHTTLLVVCGMFKMVLKL